MRIGSNNNIKSGYSSSSLYNEIKLLESIFKTIILVNPIEHSVINVTQYNLEDKHLDCRKICPLVYDKCGCICKDTVSTEENRCRFIYNKTKSHLVISKYVKMQYRDYVLVMIMEINPSFQFGAYRETEAIESITKLSSNLVIDPLTQIFNRKYLMDNIDFLIQDCSSKNKNLCLACIDIDNFKKFNDTYGHEFGDLVLKKTAELMVESTEVLNEAYNIRIGGDEFLIIAVGVEKQRFKAIMNKLCIMVDNTKLKYNKENVGIKISIGVSEMMADRASNYKQLYEKADSQLYLAKEAGKGCVR